jgi:hypothetical protein
VHPAPAILFPFNPHKPVWKKGLVKLASCIQVFAGLIDVLKSIEVHGDTPLSKAFSLISKG